MHRKHLIGLAIVALAIGGAYALFASRHTAPGDPLLGRVYERAAQVQAYTQDVRTEVRFPGQTLTIEGRYLVDRTAKRYASVATTTLRSGKLPSRSFTLSNVSLGTLVYARVDTRDGDLVASFPRVGAWERFDARAIPERYAGIAIPGPILDNLRILDDSGSFLVPLGAPVPEDGLMRYRFELAPAHRGVTEGTLAVLLGRIATGTVSLWVTPEGEPRQLAFDGAGYRSTTTLSALDTPLTIEAPLVQ